MVVLKVEHQEFATFEFDQQLDIIADAFEEDWKGGFSPSVREYANLVEPRYQKRLLRELILIERECFGFFGDPPPPTEAGTDTVRTRLTSKIAAEHVWKTSDAFDLPSHFERFAITKLLGKGSHGVVYEAEDLQIRRRVAIKIAHASCGDSSGNRAFTCEAANASRVNHPSVVRVLDVGEFRGTHYMVSELIEGANLAEFSRSKKLSDVACAHILADIAAGVEAAHQYGVIHRDLKPSNIMIEFIGTGLADDTNASLAFSPDAFHVRILDFGIAKVIGGTTRRTVDGDIVGTPHYMSPEQAAGDSANVDGRSDIFSLGVVLFELLTGKLPFDGPELSVVTGIRDLKAPSVRAFRNDIPLGLERIVSRCLERKPSHRYQSAAELEADLRNWSSGKRLSFRRLQLRRWANSTVFLLLVVCLGVLSFLTRNEWIGKSGSVSENSVKFISVAPPANRPERLRYLEDWVELGEPQSLLDWASCNDGDVAMDAVDLVETNQAGLTEVQGHRIRLAELCISKGTEFDSSDAKRFAVELMGPSSGNEKVWFQLLNRMSDRFVRELESILTQDWDARQRRLLFSVLKDKWELAGDTEGLTRLLGFAQTEELSLIVPAVLRVSRKPDSDFRTSLLAELDNTDPSPEAGLGTDQSSRWRAKLGLVAYGLGEWERVDRVLSRATDPRPRSYFVYWFRHCEFSIEPLVRRFAEFNDEWRATSAIECIVNVYNQIVSQSLRSECVELLSGAYESHPSARVHNAARKWLIACGHEGRVRAADSLSEFKQIRNDRNWYHNSSGMQMNIVRGPSEFWFGMPAKGKRPGKSHCIDHSFAIADQMITEKDFAEFDPARYTQPTDSIALDTTWFEAIRYCDWMNRKEGLSSPESLENVDETFQRFSLSESGYRLPSVWEWECYFRAGTRTSFLFGESGMELFPAFKDSIETHAVEWTSTTYKSYLNENDHDLVRMQSLILAKGGSVSITNSFLPLGENRLQTCNQKSPFGFRLAISFPTSNLR